MASILDNFDTIDEYSTYVDEDGTFILEFLEDSPLVNITEEAFPEDDFDTENPALVEFRSLLFDTVYHQLDIREWVV